MFRLWFALLPTLLIPRDSRADAAGRIGQLAQELTNVYAGKRPQATGETLAVFTFATTPALEKRGAGVAVAEMLTSRLVNGGQFTVVERAALNRILEEHALSLTGAVDPDAAVRVGRLLGAKLVVLGSIHPLGDKYQISARLVEVESGEVLAAAYREEDRRVFEEEAKPYLILVPETQALCLYVKAGFGNGKAVALAGSAYSGQTDTGVPVTLVEKAENASYRALQVGAGGRYLPWPWLQLDASISQSAPAASFDERPHVVATISDGSGPNASNDAGKTITLNSLLLSLRMNWLTTFGSGGTWRRRVGAGFDVVRLSLTGARDGNASFSFSPPGVGAATRVEVRPVESSRETMVTTRQALTAGIEWRPQPRIGVELSADVYPVALKETVSALVLGYSPTVPTGTISRFTETVPLAEITFPRVVASLALTFSF